MELLTQLKKSVKNAILISRLLWEGDSDTHFCETLKWKDIIQTEKKMSGNNNSLKGGRKGKWVIHPKNKWWTDLQKCATQATQGRGNFLIIAEIASINPTERLFSTKIRTPFCQIWEIKCSLFIIKGKFS